MEESPQNLAQFIQFHPNWCTQFFFSFIFCVGGDIEMNLEILIFYPPLMWDLMI